MIRGLRDYSMYAQAEFSTLSGLQGRPRKKCLVAAQSGRTATAAIQAYNAIRVEAKIWGLGVQGFET